MLLLCSMMLEKEAIMENGSKRENFKRLASQRTSVLLKRIKILGHCANRQYYEYTEDDIKKIFSALEKQLQEVKSRFRANAEPEEDFKL